MKVVLLVGMFPCNELRALFVKRMGVYCCICFLCLCIRGTSHCWKLLRIAIIS